MTGLKFTRHNVESAPEESRRFVVNAQQSFGFLPSPVAMMAEAPLLLEAFISCNGLFNKTSLSNTEREVLIMRVATRHGCDYCVAMHSSILKRTGADGDLIESLRRRSPLQDARLQAMATFVDAVQEGHGAVSDADLTKFFDAGYTNKMALEVVLGIGIYTLSTYANRLTRAPLDPAFEATRWEQPITLRSAPTGSTMTTMHS